MKNIKKLICVLICVIICISLCSCGVMGDLRSRQAYYDKDKNIVLGDKVYKLLPVCDDFSPNLDYTDSIYLTTEEVPVLISVISGFEPELSENGFFIFSDGDFYVREDMYDSIAKRINSGNYFEGYAFEYSFYEYNEELADVIYDTDFKMLDNDCYLAIMDILTNYVPEDADAALLDNYVVTDIFLTSKDFYFRKYATTVYKTDAEICISNYDAASGIEKLYRVPEKYSELLNAVIEEFYKLDITYDEYFDKYGDDYFYD